VIGEVEKAARSRGPIAAGSQSIIVNPTLKLVRVIFVDIGAGWR